MNLLMKWTAVFLVLMMAMQTGRAWNIGSKTTLTGSTIHSTYFLTPNNAPFTVQAKAYMGYLINGICQYATIYDVGSEVLKTGDTVNIDGLLLASLVGNGYSCMTLSYTNQQTARETFQLYFDGLHYNLSQPAMAEVMIL